MHINRNCIAYVASLKTLREKPSSKNSQKEKEHNNKPSWLHIILYLLFFMNRDIFKIMHELHGSCNNDLQDLKQSSGTPSW